MLICCRYALKEVNIKAMSQKEREDAVNEVRILASVEHAMVIRYHDAFIENDKLWIVTELAKGGDIGAKVKRHQQRHEFMPEDMIWGFFIQICQGLRNLHAANILHRDIKSQNIFLVTAREIKIGDLGVAKITKSGMAHTQIGYCNSEL
jgi:NIMA (never in mitosis gene a)-related kinase 1/4/5